MFFTLAALTLFTTPFILFRRASHVNRWYSTLLLSWTFFIIRAKVGITVPKKEKLLAPMTIEVLTFALKVQAHQWPNTLSPKTSKTKNCLIYIYIYIFIRHRSATVGIIFLVLFGHAWPTYMQWSFWASVAQKSNPRQQKELWITKINNLV